MKYTVEEKYAECCTYRPDAQYGPFDTIEEAEDKAMSLVGYDGPTQVYTEEETLYNRNVYDEDELPTGQSMDGVFRVYPARSIWRDGEMLWQAGNPLPCGIDMGDYDIWIRELEN